MKYRFVGGQDVPEWILAEVSVLSKISCVRLKLICRQVINELAGGELDFDKVGKLIPKDSGFTWSDVKATVAAIAFVLAAATKYDVDHDALNADLQQLGLPKENSDGISRPFRIHRDRLRAQALSDSLRLPRLVSLDYRTDAVVATSVAGPLRAPAGAAGSGLAPETVVQLRLGLSHGLTARATRVPLQDEPLTPLLLAAAAAATGARARAASGAGAVAAAHNALLDAAAVALGVVPIVPPPAGGGSGGGGADGLRSPTRGGGTLTSPTSVLGSVAAAAAGASATAKVLPRATADVTLSAEQLAALIAELKIARKVVSNLTAALSTATTGAAAGAAAAAGGAGGGFGPLDTDPTIDDGS